MLKTQTLNKILKKNLNLLFKIYILAIQKSYLSLRIFEISYLLSQLKVNLTTKELQFGALFTFYKIGIFHL